MAPIRHIWKNNKNNEKFRFFPISKFGVKFQKCLFVAHIMHIIEKKHNKIK